MDEDEEANRLLAEQNIEQAIKKHGIDPNVARQLYGCVEPRT